MKTLYLTAVSVIAFIFAIAFYSNTYSTINDNNCKCCDTKCAEAGCCTEKSGSSQGETVSCCSEKCTTENCKECCAAGECKMTGDKKIKSEAGQGNCNMDNSSKSGCKEMSGSGMKNCCK